MDSFRSLCSQYPEGFAIFVRAWENPKLAYLVEIAIEKKVKEKDMDIISYYNHYFI